MIQKRKPLFICLIVCLLTFFNSDAAESDSLKINYLEQRNNAYENGHFEKAISTYEKSLRDNPDNPDIYVNIGSAYYSLGEPQETFSYYRKAIQLYRAQGNIAKAEALAEEIDNIMHKIFNSLDNKINRLIDKLKSKDVLTKKDLQDIK